MTELRPGTSKDAGLDESRLERLRQLCQRWVDDGTHPALAVVVARHGVVALHEAYGRVGSEPDSPALDVDSIFPLASVTKPFTATAIMALVEDGLVGLTRPVHEYVPTFQCGEDVCVHHLLTHTSGLSDEDALSYVLTNWDSTDIPPAPPGADDMLHKQLVLAGRTPLRTKPGELMNYANGNYVALGEVVRAAAGCSFEEVIHERVFAPLGMKNSTFGPPPDAVERVVRRPSPVSDLAASFGRLMRAAGGIHSTAMDVAVFGQTFLNGGVYGDTRILNTHTVAEMTRNQIPGVRATLGPLCMDEASWGYGWGISCTQKWPSFPAFPEDTFHHPGGTGTFLWVDARRDLVGVFLSVANTIPVEGQLFAELIWNVDLFANAAYAAVE